MVRLKTRRWLRSESVSELSYCLKVGEKRFEFTFVNFSKGDCGKHALNATAFYRMNNSRDLCELSFKIALV